MFETLMGLSLFKGISDTSLSKTVGANKFHFLKYSPDSVIYNAGDPCLDVTFILSGTVRITIANPDGRFSVSQSLGANEVISPEFLFGRITRFPGLVAAVDTVSILRIPKSDYINILNSDPIFLFNYLNLLSMNAQKAVEGILAVSTGDIAERIAFWISALTQPRSFDIVLESPGRGLSPLFGVPRTILKSVLDEMKERGLVDYSPGIIRVLDRRKLLSLLNNHSEDPGE